MKSDLNTAGTHKTPSETPAPHGVIAQAESFLTALGLDSDAFRGSYEVPHRRLERWKYTPISSILQSPLQPAQPKSISSEFQANPIPGLDAYSIIFVNGFVDLEKCNLPVIDGLSVSFSTENETEPKDWFSCLHAQMKPSGMTLRVENGVVLDRPVLVHEVFTGQEEAAFLSHRIEVAAHAQVEMISWTASVPESTGFCSTSWDIEVADEALLGLDVVQCDNPGLHRLVYTNVNQGKSSRFRTHTATTSGDWVRNDLQICLRAPGADVVLHGLFLPLGQERIDNHTTVDHEAPHCTSSELYRGVLYDASNGVFNGKVFVRQDAQKTNAYQQSNNILASPRATMNAKPELEIYADDVQCSHGCTIGQLDDDALFYCQTRGIVASEAQALLVRAFIADIAEGFGCQEVRDEVMHLLAERHGWMPETL